jgi:glutathione S-transferase
MAAPQFTLYAHAGPNPWKVAMVLEELGLSYKIIIVNTEAGEHKKPPYTNLNPNGRMPTLVDHSNDEFVVWESGAIMLYLVEKYDTDHKISFASFESEAKAKQYLMFQMSGQGPYFGNFPPRLILW